MRIEVPRSIAQPDCNAFTPHRQSYLLAVGMMPMIVALVAFMVVVDAAWSISIGFTIRDVGAKAVQVACVAFVASVYLRFRPNSRLAEMTGYVLLWACFSTAAAVLTYLTASLDFPLRDGLFIRYDLALGFDLGRWTRLLQWDQAAYHVLQIDYFSLIPQIAGTAVWLAHKRVRHRNGELLLAAILGLIITSFISALLPAIGPSPATNPALAGRAPAYVTEILAMRAHEPLSRSLADLQGIVCFPSYHTVLALLIVWAHRGLTSFWPSVVWNGLMLLAVTSVGNHYLTDMLGGALVALGSIVVAGRAANLLAMPISRRFNLLGSSEPQ